MTEPTLLPPGEKQPPISETAEVTVGDGVSENPIEGSKLAVTGVRGGANMYGAFSIETFCQAGGLGATHEDADGFLAYVRQFTPINFWYKDCGVRVWAYDEDYDNWQDTYGMDAVCVVYHSGHGGMDANGVFYAPMGCDWARQHDCTAISRHMHLGNEHARYIFWSTCLSLRVHDGHNPVRTWGHSPNPGWRMLFGFETTSWDDPNYGRNFWNHWRRGESFSSSWLNGSWDIAHDQAPAVVACGATAEESKNRVFNERYFDCGAVSHNWYWWRWYDAAKAVRELELALPKHMLIARLQPVVAAVPSARAVADRFQLDMTFPSVGVAGPDRGYRVTDGDKRISYSNDGSLDVQMAKPNLANRQEIPMQRASTLAQDAVRRYGLDELAPVVPDRILLARDSGGRSDGSGQLEGPYTSATVVQYRQVINGLPVITPGLGTVRITVDNDGAVTNVHSSVRAIERLSDRAMSPSDMPEPPGVVAAPGALAPEPSDPRDYEQKLAATFGKQLSLWAVKGWMPLAFTTVPGSTEIGYDIRGNEAALIARKAVEVDFGSGYRKRYWVTTPLYE